MVSAILVYERIRAQRLLEAGGVNVYNRVDFGGIMLGTQI